MTAQRRVVIAQAEAEHLTDAELERALHDGRAWDVFMLDDMVLLMAGGEQDPASLQAGGIQ